MRHTWGRCGEYVPDCLRDAVRASRALAFCFGPMYFIDSSKSRSSHQNVPSSQPPSAQAALASSSCCVVDCTAASAALPDEDRLQITPGHFAYLKISEGCDRLCTFCAIPKMRGKHASKPMDPTARKVDWAIVSGSVELIMLS